MSSRRLVVLRHAQASDGGRDFDRTLTERGRADAAAAGAWLAAHALVPDVVVVSPARRAVQTWEAASGRLPASPELRYEDRIYDNSVDDLLAVLSDVDDNVRTVLLVGHNPSVHALAVLLAGHDPARDELAAFPTATAAVFALDGAWSSAPDLQAHVVSVVTARADGSL